MRIALTMMAALAVAGCQVERTTASETSETRSTSGTSIDANDAQSIVDRAYASFTSGDAIKIMEHYHPNAVVFDAAHTQPATERSTVTKWTADFAAMKPSDFTTNPRIVQSFNHDTIVSSGIAAFLADVAGNRQRVSVRYTHVFQRQADGRWLIVSEHNSLPPEPVI